MDFAFISSALTQDKQQHCRDLELVCRSYRGYTFSQDTVYDSRTTIQDSNREDLEQDSMATETWNPDSTSFPTLHNLPPIQGAPKYAAWFWGKDDYCGRLNLLTPTRVKAAAAEIKTGEMARTDLPLHIPEKPGFGRQKFQLEIKPLQKDRAYDDVHCLNTQSSTQWDGFRHVAHRDSGYFYNWTRGSDIDGERPNEKDSIHYWSEHGFAGRGGNDQRRLETSNR